MQRKKNDETWLDWAVDVLQSREDLKWCDEAQIAHAGDTSMLRRRSTTQQHVAAQEEAEAARLEAVEKSTAGGTTAKAMRAADAEGAAASTCRARQAGKEAQEGESTAAQGACRCDDPTQPRRAVLPQAHRRRAEKLRGVPAAKSQGANRR